MQPELTLTTPCLSPLTGDHYGRMIRRNRGRETRRSENLFHTRKPHHAQLIKLLEEVRIEIETIYFLLDCI